MTNQKTIKPCRKPYQRPAIVFSTRLEAQAGSPLSNDSLQNLFDGNQLDSGQ